MDKIKCDKCGNMYDLNLGKCPICSNTTKDEFNINNPFLKLSKTYKEEKEKEEEKKEPIEKKEDELLNKIDIKPVTEENKSIIESKPSKKEEKIEKQISIVENKSVKKKKTSNKQNNSFFSYLLLILGMILLFIAVLSSIIELSVPLLCHYCGTVVVLMIAFNLTIRNKDFGYYLSILASVSMICMLFECDYISAIIGVYLFTSSFVYLAKN